MVYRECNQLYRRIISETPKGLCTATFFTVNFKLLPRQHLSNPMSCTYRHHDDEQVDQY
jgi:hypothetical protein